MIDFKKYHLEKKENTIDFWRTFLIQSDYEVIKAMELGIELDSELKKERQHARDKINELEGK